MRSLSATEARKKFFEILDFAVEGEEVLIERKGVPLKIVRVAKKNATSSGRRPCYAQWIHGNVEEADQWSWDWDPSKFTCK